MPATSQIAIAIATRDRKEDLRHTLGVLSHLDPAPREIMVCADGCSDGTAEMVRAEFSDCRVLEQQPPRGSIASRDRMLRESDAPLMLLLDDDSHPVATNFLAVAEGLFAADPALAVLTFPQRSDEFPETLEQTDFGPSVLVGSFADSGAILRREHYLDSPGYPAEFFHAYEEPDYSLQCLAAGRKVLLCTGLTVRHRYTPRERSERRTHFYHARNEWWSVWLRCPLPQAIFVAKYRALRQFGYAWRRGGSWVWREPLWWASAIAGWLTILRKRQPVPWDVYRQWIALNRNPQPVDPPKSGEPV